MDQTSPTKKRVTASPRVLSAKKMRESPEEELPYHWRGSTPYQHVRQRRLERLKDEEARHFSVAESVSFTGRLLDSPYYNKTSSYFTSVFEQLSCLGSGDYGKVFKCRSKDDGKLYAVKVLSREFQSEKDRLNMTREVELLETTPPHENIVRFVLAWQENMTLYIQTELCAGDLLSFLKSLVQPINANEEPRYAEPDKVPETICWKVMVDILLGAAFLHSNGVLHLDIKPENIFIGLTDGRFKLGDFGIAQKKEDAVNLDQDGDGRYAAPETYDCSGKSHGFTEKADVFSIGCTVAQVALGITHPRHPRYEDYWSKLKLSVSEWHTDPDLVQDMSDKSKELWDVVKWLLSFDPKDRPTAQEVLDDPAVQTHLAERKRRLVMDRLLSRIRATVSNVITILNQYLPRDLISRLKPIMIKGPSSPYEMPPQLSPCPPTPRAASVRSPATLGLSRIHRLGLGASSTPSRLLLDSDSEEEDEVVGRRMDLTAAFSHEELSPIKALQQQQKEKKREDY